MSKFKNNNTMKTNTNYRIGASGTNIQNKNGGHIIWWITLMISLFMIPNNVWADGSKDLYPKSMESNSLAIRGELNICRSTSRQAYAPFATDGEIYAYAKKGEIIYVANSAMGNSSTKDVYKGGTIKIINPNGTIVLNTADSTNVNKGEIKTRTQELAGPKLNSSSSSDCYDAFEYIAQMDGVYTIQMTTPTKTNSTKASESSLSLKDGKFQTAVSTISAWDVSVSDNKKTKFYTGRVYCTELNLSFCGSSNTDKGWYSDFYVLTNTGYVYVVNGNGMNGEMCAFVVNNKGIQNEPPKNYERNTNAVYGTSPSMNGSFSGVYGGLASYADATSTKTFNIKDPRFADYEAYKNDLDGNEGTTPELKYTEDVTHKLFYTIPDFDNLPKEADVYLYDYTGKTQAKRKTWLNVGFQFEEPKIDKLALVGKESFVPDVVGPEGAYIYFESSSEGDVDITLLFNTGETKTWTEKCVKGVNAIAWDGKDDKGNNMLTTEISLQAVIKVAEIHFPLLDVEKNPNGVKIQLVKGYSDQKIYDSPKPSNYIKYDPSNWDGTPEGLSKLNDWSSNKLTVKKLEYSYELDENQEYYLEKLTTTTYNAGRSYKSYTLGNGTTSGPDLTDNKIDAKCNILLEGTKVHYPGCSSDLDKLNSFGSKFADGNNTIKDNWTYLNGDLNPDPKKCHPHYYITDLAVTNMFTKDDIGKKHVGEFIDFYVEVENVENQWNTEKNISTGEYIYKLKDTIENAAISIDGNWPEYKDALKVTYVGLDKNYVDDDKDDKSICAFLVDEDPRYSKGIFSLALGRKQQFIIRCEILQPTSLINIDPIAYVLRPGDINDYQAFSEILDNGAPLDPYIEAGWGTFDDFTYGENKAGVETPCNNIVRYSDFVKNNKTDDVYIWNSAPVANLDSIFVTKNYTFEGNVITGNGSKNGGVDSDIDKNGIKLISFTVGGVSYKLSDGVITIKDATDNTKTAGAIEFNQDGSYSFEPAENYIGTPEVIKYTIEDIAPSQTDNPLFYTNKDITYTSTANLVIKVVENSAPHLTERTYYVQKGGSFELDWTDNEGDGVSNGELVGNNADKFTIDKTVITAKTTTEVGEYNDIYVKLTDNDSNKQTTECDPNNNIGEKITIVVYDLDKDIYPVVKGATEYVETLSSQNVDVSNGIVKVIDIDNLVVVSPSETTTNDDGVTYKLEGDKCFSIDSKTGVVYIDFSLVTRINYTIVVTATTNGSNVANQISESVIIPIDIDFFADFDKGDTTLLVGSNYLLNTYYIPNSISGEFTYKWFTVTENDEIDEVINDYVVGSKNVTSTTETVLKNVCEVTLTTNIIKVEKYADAIHYLFVDPTSDDIKVCTTKVNHAKFVIPVATAKDIDYGNVVNIIENDKGIPGTFIYTDANENELDKTKIYDAGEYTYNVKFVPDDVTISPIDLDPISFTISKCPLNLNCEVEKTIDYGGFWGNLVHLSSISPDGSIKVELNNSEINLVLGDIVPYYKDGAEIKVSIIPNNPTNYEPDVKGPFKFKTNPICSLKDNNPEYGATFADIFDFKLAADGKWEFIIGDKTYSKDDIIPFSESQQNIQVKFTLENAPVGEFALEPTNLITTQKHKLYVCITKGVDKTYDGNDVVPAGYEISNLHIISHDNVDYTNHSAKYIDAKIGNEKEIHLVSISLTGTDKEKYEIVKNYDSETKQPYYSKGAIIPPVIQLNVPNSQEVVFGTDDATIGKGVKAQLNVTYNEEMGIIKYIEGSNQLDNGYLLPVGDHNIKASFYPYYDLSNSASSSETKLVKVILPTMTFEPKENVAYGSDDAIVGKGIKATVNTPAGIIKYYENEVEIPNLTGLPAGNHTITAKYFGKTTDTEPMLTQTKSVKVNPLEIDVKVDDVLVSNGDNPYKVYDRTTVVPESFYKKSIKINGVVINVVAEFVNKNATSSNNTNNFVDNKVKYTLSLKDATNSSYSLKQSVIYGSGAITKKDVNVSFVVSDRIYKGSSDKEATISSASIEKLGNDEVAVKVSGKGTFAEAKVGDGITVTADKSIFSLEGKDSGNYNIAGVNSSKGNIKPETLSANLSDITNSSPSKPYDGTTNIPSDFSYETTITAKTPTGIEVECTVTAEYISKNVEDGTGTESVVYHITPNDNQYAPFDIKGNGTIIPKTVTVSGGTVTKSKVYDGNKTASTSITGASVSGLISSDNGKVSVESITAEYNDEDVKDANSIKVHYVLSGDEAKNYKVDDETITDNVEITPKEIEVENTVVEERIYNGTNEATITNNGNIKEGSIITGDVVTIASATGNYGDSNVGDNKDITVNYTLGGADKDNYTVKNNSLKGNIKPNGDHKITLSDIVSSDPNKVYDGTTTVDSDDYNHTITVDGENGETITYTITAEYEKSDAGDDIKIVYTVTPNSSNYETFKLEGKGKITPKEIIVDGTIVKGNKTYDGKTDIEIETLGTLKDVNGNNIEFTAEADFLTSDVNPDNDGKQDVKIVYTITNSDAAKNYTVKDGTAKSTINPKEVTVDFTIADKYYDGTTTVTINDASIASGVIDADKNKVSVSPITNAVANFNDPNKGDGKTVTANKDQFTLSGDKKENYVIGTINSLLGGKINGSEIKGITLADITDGVYGEVKYNGPTTNTDDINVEYTYVLNGVDGNGNSVTDKPYTLGDIIPAGTWTITAKVNDSNYGGSGTSNTFTVNKKELYITELTIADKIYDATQNATISNSNNIQFTGKVGSDNVSVDVTSATALFDNSNAGENKNVSVTGISLTGSDAANYTVSNTYNAKGNINPKTINIVAEDMSNSTYGDKYQGEITPSDFIPNHKPTDYTYTLVDKDGNETPFNPTSDYIPAGEDWKIKVTVNDPNYSGSDETNSFNVDKKQLTVSDIVVNDKSYDGSTTASVADGFTVNGKVGNDVVNVSVNTANFSDPNIANNKNVDITFLLDDNSAKNYTILAANGKGNILPANVTINVDGLVDGIYGDVVINKDDITNPEGYDGDYTITIKDPSTGETQTLKPGDVIPAGNWEITVSVDDPNYTGSQTFGPITVDKKQLTVSDIVVNDKLYDGSITATIEDGFTVNGKVGADVVNVTVKTAEFVDKNVADNKDVKVTFTLDENSAKNYEVLDASPKGNILPINVTIKVDDVIDGTYGDVVITKDDISNPEGYDGDYIITIKDTKTGETQTLKPGDYIPAGNWEITVTVDDPNYTGSTTLDEPINVDKKQLTVTDLVVNPKNYDGTKDATIADGFTVNGKVGDDVVVPTVKKAQFVDAEIGEDKDVDVEFTLSGDDAKNYEIVSAKGKGSIFGKISVVDDKVTPTKEGYTQEYERYCPGDKVELLAQIDGYATECYIDFDSKAVEAGITSTGWISVESPSFEIPQDAKAGSYSGTIKYRNGNIESDVYNFTFKVNIGSEYVTSRFHDVVLVDNHEGRFASYQWYYGEDEVNLNIVDNETKQFYQDKRGQNRGLDGWYSAEVTTVDGEVLMTCPNYYAEIEVMDAIELCVNPNPIMNMQEFTVTLKCVTNEMLQTASMTITTSAGVNVKTINKVERNNFFRLKSGEYVVTAVIDGKMYSAKFIVK